MAGSTANGTLYLCATPIGNLEDITLRVLRILKEVSLIAAEDTRHTRKLLSFYDIHTPITSYHEHNKREKGLKLLDELKAGKDIALVSDAGTPGVSDPGSDLVSLAHSEGMKIIPLPGPSAVITALVVSGLCTDSFVFEGFLPRMKKGRNKVLDRVMSDERTVVFYESPHRVLKTLLEIKEKSGDRRIAVARELTKAHEQVLRGSISEVCDHFEKNSPRGEFTIVLEGRAKEKDAPGLTGPREVVALVESLIAEGWDKKDALKEAARQGGLSKREVYRLVLDSEEG